MPETNAAARVDQSVVGPRGLGGWLVLVALGLLLWPFLQAYHIYDSIYLPLTDVDYAAFSDPGSPAYQPWFSALVFIEAFFYVLVLLLALACLYLFFLKSRRFPAFYITLLLLALAVTAADVVAITQVFPQLEMSEILDPDTTRQIVHQCIHCAIWIPYMRLSKRVKATFTE